MSVSFDSIPTREKEFRDFVGQLFVAKREGPDGFLHAAVGLAGEAGEVLDHMKKHWVYDRPMDREKVLEEMGDTLHYLIMCCIKMSEDDGSPEAGYVTLSTLIQHNMRKLRKRYPDGFTKEAAIARADKAPEAFADFDHECVPGN